MKSLWAPWRMTYIEQGKTAGCIFCDQPRAADARSGLVLAQSAHAVVMLNKYPYNSGHLLVAPKRHVDQLGALPQEEHRDLCETLRMSVGILRDELRPGGFNLGMNLGTCAGAGIREHFHLHVVPRWAGDANFMSITGETRVLPEELSVTYRRLSEVL